MLARSPSGLKHFPQWNRKAKNNTSAGEWQERGRADPSSPCRSLASALSGVNNEDLIRSPGRQLNGQLTQRRLFQISTTISIKLHSECLLYLEIPGNDHMKLLVVTMILKRKASRTWRPTSVIFSVMFQDMKFNPVLYKILWHAMIHVRSLFKFP